MHFQSLASNTMGKLSLQQTVLVNSRLAKYNQVVLLAWEDVETCLCQSNFYTQYLSQ